MRQLSLFDDDAALAGVIPAVKAAMNRIACEGSEGRDLLLDKINAVARCSGVKLTTGNAKSVSRDTFDKWLSPGDTDHLPSIMAVLAFCVATGDPAPLRIMARSVGVDIMTDADRRYRDIGLADVEMEAARKRKKQAKEKL